MSPPRPSWLRRRRARIALAGAVVTVAVALGPRERFEERWEARTLTPGWPDRLAASEAAVPGVRAGDQAEVVWADPATRGPTDVSLVYLHGFSADRHEVEPLVTRVAAAVGANVYFARLRGHGRDGAAMAEATVEDWLDDTAHAYEVGRALGRRVVLMGTSTGGTLAAWAAARDEVGDELGAVVLISPNFHPRDRTSRVLLWPWGGLLARLFVGPERCFEPLNEGQDRHWTTCYPTEALLPMMALVEHVRGMDLGGIEAPTLVVYSGSDRVVDPAETERVLSGVSAPLGILRYAASSDPDQHVLAGDVLSPASTEDLTARIVEFVRTHLDVAAAPGDEPDDDGGAPASGGDAAGVAGAGAG